MESLQEKSLITAMLSPYSDEVVLIYLLLRMLNFNQLSERTLYLIWYLYDEDRIVQKLSSKYIKNERWYNECETYCPPEKM